jgi:hypothetical protein
MNKKSAYGLAASVALGCIITLLSGSFKTPWIPIGVDVVYKGMPLPWIIQVIPRPGAVLWDGLAVDLAFWILTISIILMVAANFTKKTQ